ncbi:MAG TPA: sigma-54 dependent transcriptional regulator [Deltaproteobacteria bacterium]|nr:sigma-54 dependent transcriptional regulator [Deltaproteobacteria bacterium]HQI80002.1 sigma-54 dependent transcriptional regulator [Deltaproteobacteria bacterium]
MAEAVQDQGRFALLCVDDDPTIITMLTHIFLKDDYAIFTAERASDALELMKRVRIDAALVDYMMPEMDGLSLIKVMHEEHPSTMVIMVTAHGGIQEAVQAIKLGAVDFMEKPFSVEAIRSRVAHLYQIWQLRHENRRLREKVQLKFGYEQLVGNSTAMLRLKERIAQVGPTDASVIIEGETGTGKELVARAIHHHSHRSHHVFMPVDCGAIAESVIESELFGHVKGAFTGAHDASQGLIRSANGGTLFFDEVGELPLAIQVKLLRTIQEREVRPVGSPRSYPIDVRIVAATNKNLAEEAAVGRFREDLLYRLNVVSIHVPPLRDHKEDIPLLARFFVKDFRTSVSRVKDISREAIECLERYAWPGNIRELANVIRRATALGAGDSILPEDLPRHIHAGPEAAGRSVEPEDGTLEAYEKAAILNALATSRGNRKKAARILGIGEATLYRKIARYGLSAGQADGAEVDGG